MTKLRTIFAALSLSIGAGAGAAFAQDAGSSPGEENDDEILSVIEEDPIVSSRAAGMGGAVSTVADGVDAAFKNPAGIGGLDWGRTRPPWVRRLYFPRLSLSANQNSQSLHKEFKAKGGRRDKTVGKAIVEANEGKRQYGRANSVLGTVIGRTMFVGFSDVQVAATSQGDGEGTVETRYRNLSGVGFGGSVVDPTGSLALGYFGYYGSRSETSGNFLYEDIIDTNKRKQALDDKTKKYTGLVHNAGLRYRFDAVAHPALAAVVKHAGDSTFSGAETLTKKQDVTVGFSLSPRFDDWGKLDFITEAAHITDEAVSLAEKFRAGLEWLLGPPGSYAHMGVRAGYNHAGASYGLSLNLDLIQLEVADHPVDIGKDNAFVPERRRTATFSVDVAEF